MAKADIKRQLHKYIEMIEDEQQLEMLCEAAETYASAKRPDILDSLSEEQLKRLEESIQQANDGHLTSHETVMTMVKQWLTK